jgi:hypothetical protein
MDRFIVNSDLISIYEDENFPADGNQIRIKMKESKKNKVS